MRTLRRIGLFTVLALRPSPAPAQGANSADPLGATGFLAAARAGTMGYQDLNAAIAAGYRQVGPEFPGMGTHWVQPSLLIQGKVDSANPTILSYATIGGRQQLVGAAWAVPLRPGEPLPDRPVPRWHDHGGTLDEASFASGHPASGKSDGGSGWRLGVLHAWIWEANPSGDFATDNWRLPWLRAGLVPPALPDSTAALALNLATGGESFALGQVLNATPDSAESGVRDGLKRARASVDSLLRGPPVSADSLQSALGAVWREFQARLTPASLPVAGHGPTH